MQVKYVLACVLVLLFLSTIKFANADWNSLKSGYAVTTDYHGLEATAETLITATAGTVDSSITNVTFVWKYPNDTVAFVDADVQVWSNGTRFPDENGSLVYYAQSSFAPMVEGEWGVQAYFKGFGGHLRGNGTDIVAIKATSNEIVIPEISAISAFGTLGVFAVAFALLRYKKEKSK